MIGMTASSSQIQPRLSGKLAENIMHFARVLREAGIPVGPGAVLDALDAAQCGALRTRDDFYWTLHAVFIKRRDQRDIFDQAFHVFWRKPGILEQLMQLLVLRNERDVDDNTRHAVSRRLAETMLNGMEAQGQPRQNPNDIEVDASLTASADEVLRKKDFEQMSVAEQAQARQAIARLRLNRTEVMTRRFEWALNGTLIDMRRTLKGSLRAGGI